jgi:hypothetical protein
MTHIDGTETPMTTRTKRAAPRLRKLCFVLFAWTACTACESTVNLASSRTRWDGGLDASFELDAALDSGLSIGTTEAGSVALCGSRPCQCSNGSDDDNDDAIDGFDSECTGPYDDDEATFRVNDVNEGNPRCVDCFYDDNPGSGDDECRVAPSCTIDGTPSGGVGLCRKCSAGVTCAERCVPITPNGCDCFGCCEVTHAGLTVPIRLVATCNVQLIGDSNACPRCQMAEDCQNPCERCELCPGKTLADLPRDCMGENACDNRKSCLTPNDCAFVEYCSQGCCVPILY